MCSNVMRDLGNPAAGGKKKEEPKEEEEEEMGMSLFD